MEGFFRGKIPAVPEFQLTGCIRIPGSSVPEPKQKDWISPILTGLAPLNNHKDKTTPQNGKKQS